MYAILICELDSDLEDLKSGNYNFVFRYFLAKFVKCMHGLSSVCMFILCNCVYFSIRSV